MATLSYEAIRDYAVELEQTNERLRDQLRQAQKKLAWHKADKADVAAARNEARAERDAAIERGAAVCNEVVLLDDTTINLWRMQAEAAEAKLAHLEGKANDNDCPYLADKIRAEKGEASQRALAEARGQLIEEIAQALEARRKPWAYEIRGRAKFTPVEAFRAEHRTPPSGEEEGDDA